MKLLTNCSNCNSVLDDHILYLAPILFQCSCDMMCRQFYNPAYASTDNSYIHCITFNTKDYYIIMNDEMSAIYVRNTGRRVLYIQSDKIDISNLDKLNQKLNSLIAFI